MVSVIGREFYRPSSFTYIYIGIYCCDTYTFKGKNKNVTFLFFFFIRLIFGDFFSVASLKTIDYDVGCYENRKKLLHIRRYVNNVYLPIRV